ncbi:DUF4097 and DUF4098 domain-containing protein YvlB [Paenibacillus rhizosphaerae]|uniref:DUF4097 and DUF4098 domain-containing protein YvlB n=1 Tax=Paenibacillus rhizosphaerae TaxID=297318 RepID=A0A839TYC7_9BACL|nr:DUF4097 family beta strand repeat-containing protein [Paenibacillus rhizosphaerae]MBB3131946.1 DUF4097 and DUF4098 domain-containing protein YvlB [Paenibacillus rhizosphaerae]
MNRKPKLRVGRFTAVLLLVVTGALLLTDAVQGTEYMLLLLKWWPLLAVLWGAEYIVLYWFIRKSHTPGWGRFRLDIRGMLVAVLLSAAVFVVTEQSHYLHLWNKVSLNLTAAGVDYSEAKGKRFEKEPISVPVAFETQAVNVDNINGDILLQRGPVDDIRVDTEMWVDQITGPEADVIGQESTVDVSDGGTVTIQTKGKAYGQSGKRQPRMNLTITLPEDRRFNFSIRTMNGGITLNNVEAIEQITLESANGELKLNHILGQVKGKTLNGAVQAANVTGSVDLTTNRGNMEAIDVSDSVALTSQVGNLSVVRAQGKINVSTKNGNIYVDDIKSDFAAESLNGDITARSNFVGGNWDIYSAVGELILDLPEEGSYAIDGTISYGDIHSMFPEFVVDKKSITGEIGTGDYTIHVEGNSELNVNKY